MNELLMRTFSTASKAHKSLTLKFTKIFKFISNSKMTETKKNSIYVYIITEIQVYDNNHTGRGMA